MKKVLLITALLVVALIGYGIYIWINEAQELPGILGANGIVEAEETIIASQTSGEIISVNTKEGDWVKKDDLLVVIDEELLQIKREQAKAQVKLTELALQQARNQEARIQKGINEGAKGLEQQLESAQDQVKAAEIEKEIAETAVKEIDLALEKMKIKAPMDGKVASLLVQTGEIAVPGTPIIRLFDDREMKVYVYITGKDLGKIKVNDDVRIYEDSFPDQYSVGRVAWIASEAQFTPKNVHVKEERERLVYKVEVRFTNEQERFKAGMPVDVRIRWNSQVEWN